MPNRLVSVNDAFDLPQEVLARLAVTTGPTLLFAALNPLALVTGVVIRNASGAATAAAITWPDGTTGTYTGTASPTFPGVIDSYVLTHGSSTYTQPMVTRDATGAVTSRPAIVRT